MRIGEAVERVSDSWWPIPSAGALIAVALAATLLSLDNVVQPAPAIAFRGDAGEARQLLSTITSAMLSFIGLVFSVSIIVFTLVSGQLSPRVLRTFMRDRWSQSTLAVFVGTFVLALIAFWAVRGSAGEATSFVPGLTITAVFLLVATCVGMFVHFVHHITQEIRAVTVISRISVETTAAIERRYPQPAGPSDGVQWRPPGDADHTFTADDTGVLANVRTAALVRLAERHRVVLELVPQVGDFVVEDDPLVRQHGPGDLPPGEVRDALAMDSERSYRRDVAFGIRKLLDIAERALSPGVNDPTTAIQSIDRIHAILYRLAGRKLDVGVHRGDDDAPRLVETVPSWDDYLALACDELRHWGAASPRVHERLRAMLTHLATASPTHRHAPLRRQLEALTARAETDLPDVEQRAVDDATVPSRRTADRGSSQPS